MGEESLLKEGNILFISVHRFLDGVVDDGESVLFD